MVVNVILDDPALSASLYITDVTRTTDGNDLSVVLTLTRPSEVLFGTGLEDIQRRRSRVDPAFEIGRRLERLERKDSHPAQPLGQSTGIFGVFGGAYSAIQTSGWEQITTVTIALAIEDSHGWEQVVTATTQPTFEDSHGWEQVTSIGFTPTLTADTGWAQSVNFELLGGTTVDDEVTFA